MVEINAYNWIPKQKIKICLQHSLEYFFPYVKREAYNFNKLQVSFSVSLQISLLVNESYGISEHGISCNGGECLGISITHGWHLCSSFVCWMDTSRCYLIMALITFCVDGSNFSSKSQCNEANAERDNTTTAKTKYFKAIDQSQPGPEEVLKQQQY